MPHDSGSTSPSELLLARLLLAIEEEGACDPHKWLGQQPEVLENPSLADQVIQLYQRLLVARGALLHRAEEVRWPRGLGHRSGDAVGPGLHLVRFLGAGGMGEVWEALQLPLNRSVALKLVRSDSLSGEGLERFAREARAGARLSHPSIAMTLEHGIEGALAWIALELVPGGKTLRDFIAKHTRLDTLPADYDQKVAGLIAEVADALAFAHEKGVVHRDVKPGNILLTTNDRPKVTDFGLAQILDETLTQGDVLGTYAYMSPEQVKAQKAEIDHRTDIFSLGVVLYELLTLRKPFLGDTRVQVAAKILLEDPPDPRTIRSRIPGDLAVIAAKAMEKDRGQRFPTMVELAKDLRRYLANEPIHAKPPTRLDRATKWCKRNPTKSVAAGIVSVTFTAIALLLVANKRTNWALWAKSLESEQRRVPSALQQLEDLTRDADVLWPAHPEMLPTYEEWLRKATVLVAELPGYEKKLAELRAKSMSWTEEGKTRHSEQDVEMQEEKWWFNQLQNLVQNLTAFSDSKAGLLSEGISPEHGWGIPKRAAFARTIEERSILGIEATSRWALATASIVDSKQCPAYGGLRITPQLGLLPIGCDPVTGLWEFAHLQTGEPAERGLDGKLVLTEETGLVFVLLPGGTFEMGAQNSDSSLPNYDPEAADDQGPVHAVTLSPFFLSKYEMTQGQWERFTGRNPSYHTADGKVISRLHPVEMVSWLDCMKVMERMNLSLPSEAQWEYAARGRTSSVWWTGNERDSLIGAANLADQTLQRAGAPFSDIKDWPELDDGYAFHAPVNQYRPNAFGLHNVHGNVFEWCLDGYQSDYYERAPANDPVSVPESSVSRIDRGAGFGNAAFWARSAFRAVSSPSFTGPNLGLRPARTITR